MKSSDYIKIFEQSIEHYHIDDNVNGAIKNPYASQTLEHLLYLKNWIDTVQWHLEDIIRDPHINPEDALQIKRRIDASNQQRTDMVEYIDSWFLDQYREVKPLPDAGINTETPAWAIDRLSILCLKIYHMHVEANRQEADEGHKKNAQQKLNVLLSQQQDLSVAIDELVDDIANGRKYMKLYKQMKMYNDEAFNPVLYSPKK